MRCPFSHARRTEREDEDEEEREDERENAVVYKVHRTR
jgi:hypothetical protein